MGAPDLILEVVSDSSVRKDLVRLREAYLRAGIPEYWLIDARGDDIRFEILRRRDDKYEASAPPYDPQVSRVLRARLTLRRTRNRLGRFAYRLAIGAVPSRTSRRK